MNYEIYNIEEGENFQPCYLVPLVFSLKKKNMPIVFSHELGNYN